LKARSCSHVGMTGIAIELTLNTVS
jgi:hypothetical protein